MKVLIVDTFSPNAIEQLKAAGVEVIYDVNMKDQKLADGLKTVKPDVLVVRSTKVQVPQLDAGAPELKVVVRAGSGYDTIDTKAARERGVSVCNTPGMNSTAVAELVFAHIMSFDRRIVDNVTLFREGKWSKGQFAKCKGIKGCVLGLVGFGAIGKLVCARARAFEMSIIAYDPFIPAPQMEAAGAKVVTNIMDIATACDYITIHVPGIPATKHMINDEFLSKMKPGAVLINTSRESIVDESALIKHVTKEKGIFACVDVMSGEPSGKECEFKHPFGEIKGIFVSHHIGASTLQAEAAIGEEALNVVLTFAQKGEILHCVN
jgi:D-3-phosphoglycerate dehydrogenase